MKELWRAAKQGISLGLELVSAERKAQLEEAAEILTEDFRYDMGYLKGQINRGDSREREDAAQHLDLLSGLIDGVRNEHQELEALAIVAGVRR